MPRPKKWRKVCCLPESNLFGPLVGPHTDREVVVMSVEEYEAIRLVDLENLSQEACAEKMNVARSTVQRIYIDARQKIADAIVNGKIIKIHGGDYELCKDSDSAIGCGKCRRHRCGVPPIKGEEK